MISYLLRLKKLLSTNEIQYDHHHNGNGIFYDCNGEYKFFEFIEPLFHLVVPLFQHYLFLLIYANTTKMEKMMMTIMCTGNYLVFDFFHFQKKYKPTPDRAYTPMNIYTGFTSSPKRYAMRRLKPVLNYFSNLTNDDMITFLSSLNAMVSLSLFPASISTISPSPKTLCITLSPMENFAIIISPYVCLHNQNSKYDDDNYMYRQLINLLYCKTSSLTKCINHLI